MVPLESGHNGSIMRSGGDHSTGTRVEASELGKWRSRWPRTIDEPNDNDDDYDEESDALVREELGRSFTRKFFLCATPVDRRHASYRRERGWGQG